MKKVSYAIAREAARPLQGEKGSRRRALAFGSMRMVAAAAAGALILLPVLWFATDPPSFFSRPAEAVSAASTEAPADPPPEPLVAAREEPSKPPSQALPEVVVPVRKTEAVAPVPPVSAPLPAPSAPAAAGPVRRPVAAGETVLRLCIDVYGECGAEELGAVRKANPGIRNLSRVQVGQVIVFPAVNNGRTARAPGR